MSDVIDPKQERDERIANLVHEWNTMRIAEWREMLRKGGDELDEFLRECEERRRGEVN